ncbi:conserved hypothetical protein [Leishmania braziliensis MHOM/BR/75/M2904]|uniref:Uncharacterized protein n=2 Tax=Leishmania braziliensis TaxID=5660 RepID=A4HIQ9_LEIBR|nr:conserved hypothetical protein [Leishmania braziliensis MHOM/BR/75/M2904]KAI5689896.1 hypothetical protein MNV84_06074 [Leishmania braziliensis]CAJ2477412.1 unnamed protein product [Leishmania braziliensis]CAJ2477937.1 unnamed protein product [Leishmania braziliensis]CAM40473.1 conserved hypothetical protein [Leishmania braziliensis MHOM/BR/75/M2904]SYZ68143.1 hypothetical_protein [Leishmania braziliensis MHOM/BR/75/M2904]
MSAVDFTCVVNAVLYSFSESAGTYDEYGPVSCALIGSKANDITFKLACYRDNKYICTATVLPSNDAGAHIARDGAYITFRDEKSHYWSLQFAAEDAAIEFCAQVVVAMFGSAGEPTDSILSCDVVKGKENKQIFVGNLVKAFYRAWVVQSNDSSDGLPRLGSLLEKESEDVVKFTAPASHQCVTSTMRGFEGLTVGMREGGQRLIVVPVRAKRGRGPNVNMCFYVEIVRRKDQQSSLRYQSHRGANEKSQLLLTEGDGGIATGSLAQPLGAYSGFVDGHSATVASGFSKEQFLLVDRLRDQVFTLTEQLRDTRRELDSLCADLKRQERHSGTRSLTSAQIEYSIEHLLAESEAKKNALEDKRAVIGETESRNRELESRLAKFLQTTKILGEEAKAALDDSAGERIELDRQLADTQASIVRLDGEVGDLSRHLHALNNVLRANDVRLKEERVRLNVSVNDHEVNEEKLRTLQENYSEEVARRKLLESKLVSLQEELRRFQDDVQLKESLTQQIRAKTESDSVHYAQLIQQEREQAAIELRQLKQDLIEELASRDRQYGEAKERVAAEAYEQGMAQGVEEGLADAANEGDAIAHDMAVNAQRCKAESAALQVRAQANWAASEADERNFTSQIESLQASLTGALHDINILSTQLEAAQEEHAVKVGGVYQRLSRLIHFCGAAPISQPCLEAMMRAAESGAEFDPFSFQKLEAAKEAQLARDERVAVAAWVRASVYNEPTRMPPLRPPFPYSTSSKGPLLSPETMGTKVLLSPAVHHRLPVSTEMATSITTATPVLMESTTPVAPGVVEADIPEPSAALPPPLVVPASPPAVAVTQHSEPQDTAAIQKAPQRQRVQFPSTKIRYLSDGGAAGVMTTPTHQQPPSL